jgi:hypothetical protein
MQAGTYLFDEIASTWGYVNRRIDVIADENSYGGYTALYFQDHAGTIPMTFQDLTAAGTIPTTISGGTMVTPPLSNVQSNPGTRTDNTGDGGYLITDAGVNLYVFNIQTREQGTDVFVVDVSLHDPTNNPSGQTIRIWNCGMNDWNYASDDMSYTFIASGSGSGGGGGASGDPFITPMIC